MWRLSGFNFPAPHFFAAIFFLKERYGTMYGTRRPWRLLMENVRAIAKMHSSAGKGTKTTSNAQKT